MAIGVICFEHAFVTNLLIKILEPLSTLSFVFTKEKTFFARIGWRLFKENSNTLHRVCLDKCHQKLKFRKKEKKKNTCCPNQKDKMCEGSYLNADIQNICRSRPNNFILNPHLSFQCFSNFTKQLHSLDITSN